MRRLQMFLFTYYLLTSHHRPSHFSSFFLTERASTPLSLILIFTDPVRMEAERAFVDDFTETVACPSSTQTSSVEQTNHHARCHISDRAPTRPIRHLLTIEIGLSPI